MNWPKKKIFQIRVAKKVGIDIWHLNLWFLSVKLALYSDMYCHPSK